MDTCHGDSGGGMICEVRGRQSVLGLTSWGYGCGNKESPGIYTRVSEFRDWINSFIDEESFQNKTFTMNTREYSTFEEQDLA